jgi:D-xylono/L-arabinono-1,4-lactonase
MPIEMLADYACAVGENPLWHPDERALYWTDIPAGRLYVYMPDSGTHRPCYEGRPVGGFTLEADGALLLFRDKGNVVRFREGTPEETVIASIPGLESTRFNDVIADPRGRVYAGTMSHGGGANGQLLRIDPDGSWRVVSEGYGTPNGMGFSPDGRLFYFTDSGTRRIYTFAYDAETGELAGRRLLVETPEDEAKTIGKSDGMTVDAEGMLWSARWDGGHILRLDPQGRILARIPMPARKISSVAFGGDTLEDLYATSAGGGAKATEGAAAGALFRLRPGVRGRPEFRSRMGDETDA